MLLYKGGKLREYEPLQVVIKYIGIVGFTKFKLVDMIKLDDRFEYASSSKKETDQQPENPYDTNAFRKDFITRLTRDLKTHYAGILSGMMQLSTPEYFERARIFI